MQKKKRTTRVKNKLIHKYRLVIVNGDTLEERLSLGLTRLKVLAFAGGGIILLIATTIMLVSFTPLKEYIPGYVSTSLRNEAISLAFHVDSLETALKTNMEYIESMRKALLGETISESKYIKDTAKKNSGLEKEELNIHHIKDDSILREEIALEDKYSVHLESADMEMMLLPPLKGSISAKFDPEIKHYGIDIVAQKNTPVLAIADGIAIFVGWTLETGHVLIIEHSFGMISIYKHNETILKQQGDFVKFGEVISTVGNTGKYTSGPHLHFEIWKDEFPMNPSDYFDFDESNGVF